MEPPSPNSSASKESSPVSALVQLALLSFLALFVEVAVLRWLSAETRIFSFYKNLALIGCFLGMGAGATLGRVGQWRRYFLPAVAAYSLFICLAAPSVRFVLPPSGDEYMWVVGSTTGLAALRFYATLVIFIGITVAVFFSIGQAVGAAFDGLPPLRAYSANLIGSFFGTVTFTAFSYLYVGPFWWFLLAFAMGLWLTWADRPVRFASLTLAFLSLTFMGLFAKPAIWSPYYKITLETARLPDNTEWGTMIYANAAYHLRAVDLSDAFVAAHPSVNDTPAPAYYNLPYQFSKPKRVLVIGAGAGNDVAAALRNGAEHVTAVEIDPVIADLGRQLHPEHPYSSPVVTIINDDGRAFLKRDDHRYDLIVFALIDSHTVLSSMSNVRLDNFMYTREALAQARSLLAPDGMISMTFSSGFGESWFIAQRLFHMLERVFGEPPILIPVGYDDGFTFLAGPGTHAWSAKPDVQKTTHDALDQLSKAGAQVADVELTDDWPFMYLKGRWVPTEYLAIFGLMFVLATLLVSRLTPGGLRTIDPHFFFLGAGFLLVEVRNMAELALLFGSTWLVTSFVIAGVLLMAFGANLVAGRWRVNATAAFVLLGVAVASSFFSPAALFAGATPLIKWGFGTTLLSLPFFFSGLVFSASFANAKATSIAYGSNLLGAVLGGVLEHASLAFGIRSLSAIALVIYLLAFLTRAKSPAIVPPSVVAAPPATPAPSA